MEKIADTDRLYRRLAPDQVASDDTTVLSNAFKLRGKPDPALSVDLARLTTPRETIARRNRPDFGVGELVAGQVRELGVTVRHDPIEGDEVLPPNPAHVLIEGAQTRDDCKRLADITAIIVAPTRP